MKTLILLLLLATRAFGQSLTKSDFFRERGPSEIVELSVLWGGLLADLATTESGLNRPNVRERNPLLQSRGPRIAAVLGAGGGLTFLTIKMQKHPRAMFFLDLGIGLFRGGIALHNARVR